MKRTIAIIGAQKARTSTLATTLARHPEVYFHHNEVAVFEHPWCPSPEADAFARYLLERPERIVGFKRADLLGRPEAAEQLRLVLGGDVLLIASLRDPVQRAVSALFWYVRQGLLPPIEPNELLGRLLTDREIPGFVRSHEVLAYGYYAAHLGRFQQVFGKENLIVAADREWEGAAMAELSRRTGLHGLEIDPSVHEKRGVRNVWRARITGIGLTQPRDVPDWRARTSTGSLARSATAKALASVDRAILTHALPDQDIRPDLIEKLRALYSDDLIELSSRFGVQLDQHR